MMIKSLYANYTSAILLNNAEGEFFKTTIGVRRTLYVKDVCFHQHYSTYSMKKL